MLNTNLSSSGAIVLLFFEPTTGRKGSTNHIQRLAI